MDTRRALEIFGGFMIGAGVTVTGYELAGPSAPAEPTAATQDDGEGGDGSGWPNFEMRASKTEQAGPDEAVLAEAAAQATTPPSPRCSTSRSRSPRSTSSSFPSTGS
jgi:hypothetical protein